MKLPNPLSYDALVDTGVFLKNHIIGEDSAPFDGLMFETYGDEFVFVKQALAQHPKRIATLLDCDGRTYLASGYHHVNRLGYFVSSEDLPEFDGLAVDDDDEMARYDSFPLAERSAEYLCAVANRHGNDADPDMEVGDLQIFLRSAFEILTPAQRAQFYHMPAVRASLAAGLGGDESEFNAANPVS